MSASKGFDHSGSTFDSFLEQENLLEQVEAVALKRVIAWQLRKAMQARQMTKNEMAKRLKTSRTQVNRLLDPAYVGIGLDTISRAANAVGRRIQFQLIAKGRKKSKRPARASRRRDTSRVSMLAG